MKKAYKAKWIITSSIDGKQIYDDSALVVDEGKIVDIIPQSELVEEDYKKVVDFDNAVITPGFVNLGAQLQYNDVLEVKCKTFLSKIRGLFQNIHKFFAMLGVPVNSYPMYLANVQKEYNCFGKKEKNKSFYNGVEKTLLNGITCLAQVSKDDSHFEILNDLPLKTCLFFELFSDSSKKSKLEFRKVQKKLDKLLKNKSEDTFLGVYPSSVFSVHKRLWRVLSKYARKKNLLLMTELMESQEEREWVDFGKSDLDLYNKFLGQKKLSLPKGVFSTVEYLNDLGVLAQNVIVRNGNFLEESELEELSKNGIRFAYSPKFNDLFFEKKYKFSTLLKYFPQKVGFSTGLLNSADYNILEELFSVEALLPIEELIKYITIYPAQILRLEHITGSLDVGKHADFNVFKLKNRETPDNLREHTTPFAVYIKGSRVVKNYQLENKKEND